MVIVISRKKIKTEIKRRISAKRSLIELNREGRNYDPNRPQKKLKCKRGFEYIKVPETFCIYSFNDKKNFRRVVDIINDTGKRKNTKVLLDFSQTLYVKAAAVLAFYAAVETSIKQNTSYKIVALSRKQQVNDMLKKSGLVTLCRNNISIPTFDCDHMPVISGISGQYRDDIVDFIQKKIYNDKMSAATESIYGGAVQEAINNVYYHAYPDLDPEDRRWWVKCELVDDQLFLVIYDKGVGIPATVTKNKWYGSTLEQSYPELVSKVVNELKRDGISINNVKLHAAFSLVSDAIKIAVSMADDVTGTGKTQHGQGSKSIKALVNKNERGKLWIYSNKGLYKINEGTAEVVDLPASIEGTLIQWNIKVEYDEAENHNNSQ
ncbi:ATP-binding protein [Morganella morganii]|uniref:ATP-binding protein n=1 Tax=Morganella morganii TaxID=582 RepID=UPI00339BBE8B